MKNTRTLKFCTLAVTFSMLLTLLAGCGGTSSSSPAPSAAGSTASSAPAASGSASGDTVVTVWAWDEAINIKSLNDAAAIYAKTNPDAKIDIVSMSQADVVQRMHTTLATGQTTGMPDIVLIEDNMSLGFLNSYPDAFEDLSAIVEKDAFDSYKLASTQFNGVDYGVPYDSGVAGIFYRTDYLEQAGYTAEDMQDLTWDEFIAIGADVLKTVGVPMITMDPNNLMQMRLMMQSAGRWYTAEDGTTPDLVGNEALREGFEVYKKLIDSGVATFEPVWDTFLTNIQTGKVACTMVGNWISGSIMKAEDLSGKWAVAPTPRLDNNPDSINYSNLGGSSWYVISGGNTELAKDFLSKTYCSSVELMETLANDIGQVCTLKAAAESAAYNAPSEFYGGQYIMRDFAGYPSQIKGVNYGYLTYEIDALVAASLQEYLGGGELDKVIENAQTQAEALSV